MKQHFVTASYLKAWCDPTISKGKHVWLVSKDTQEIRHQSPYEIFKENDFYTVYDSNGIKLLELENKLEIIENAFVSLRRNKLEKHGILTLEDRKTISLFIATMFVRTKLQRDEQKEIWKELLDSANELPIEQSAYIKNTLQYRQIEQLHKQPMPFHIFHFVNFAMPFLIRMNCKIMETQTKPGFITSDNPCLWFDPAIFGIGQPNLFFGLGHPELEIILPISPSQIISLKQQGPDGYISIDSYPEAVDELNKLVVGFSEKFIVLNQSRYKKHWFQKE
jgi:hypothetical protein